MEVEPIYTLQSIEEMLGSISGVEFPVASGGVN
jgi:hypothetical protein